MVVAVQVTPRHRPGNSSASNYLVAHRNVALGKLSGLSLALNNPGARYRAASKLICTP